MSNRKLFLFCIGGTGSRVLKALTFLLASGVKIEASQVIPVIIDPDRANGDVNRTIEILQKYQSIHNQISFEHNHFFQTPIATLSSLQAIGNNNGKKSKTAGFRFGIDGTKDGRFRDLIDFEQLDPSNKALISLLYSKSNLDAELKVGFKGNPNMGCVVLNKFTQSQDFIDFASRLDQNDRVFIVSSIFGGTGAAGFPLLVKNIREPQKKLPNTERVRNIKLGAITIKPYFGVAPDSTSKIDKGTFISKSKAALAYYTNNLSGENKSLNALYYIGDTQTTDYPNNEGEEAQKNHAHVIEMISALSIIDFMAIPDSKLEVNDGKANTPIFREYGIVDNSPNLRFKNLGNKSKSAIQKTLTQFTYAVQYWRKNLKNFPKEPWVSRGKIKFEDAFLSQDFYSTDLIQFCMRYVEWLKEMEQNQRSFKPFNLEGDLLHNMVSGIEQKKKGFFGKREWGFTQYEAYLNSAEREMAEFEPINKFMNLFYRATEKIYEDRIAN